MNGDKEAGFSIFWADDGLDTGPILSQKSCPILPDDTVDSLYNRFLYPEGIKSMVIINLKQLFLFFYRFNFCDTLLILNYFYFDQCYQ